MTAENDAQNKAGLALLEEQVISNTKTKEGLALLEAQVISNGAAIAELRKDVQGAVQGISQQVGATTITAAKSDPEIQALRTAFWTDLEELERKFIDRSNETLQRAEALV